jgi:hypothetical protein
VQLLLWSCLEKTVPKMMNRATSSPDLAALKSTRRKKTTSSWPSGKTLAHVNAFLEKRAADDESELKGTNLAVQWKLDTVNAHLESVLQARVNVVMVRSDTPGQRHSRAITALAQAERLKEAETEDKRASEAREVVPLPAVVDSATEGNTEA